MDRTVCVLLVLCGLSPASGESLRITDDGRSIKGALSADGARVAYLTVEKHFTSGGAYHFSGRLCIWDGQKSRVLAELPPGEPTRGAPSPETGPPGRLVWLPSGDYVLLAHWRASALFRIADGARTGVSKDGESFSLDEEWELSDADAEALNRLIHGYSRRSGLMQPGKKIRPEELPAHIARESGNWSLMHFWRSPGDPNQALYVAAEKRSDGGSHIERPRRQYIGVVDLRTGEQRRLTPETSPHVSGGTWSPDGRTIAYQKASSRDVGAAVLYDRLRIVSPDGTGDRALVDGVRTWYWVSPAHLLVATGPSTWDVPRSEPQQLCEVDVRTGTVRRLTKGYFYHELCDVHGRKYLVVQRPVGGSEYQGNMWLFEP